MRLVFSAKQNIAETLYHALREPLGLRIRFEDISIKTARQWFYVEMRRRAPEFDTLSLVNLDDNELWIVRTDVPLQRTPNPSQHPANSGEL